MTMILSTHLIYFKLVIKQCWVFCGFATLLVLKWEKNETEKEIHETTKALHREIDISRLYEGMEPNTTYRLVSMVKIRKTRSQMFILLFLGYSLRMCKCRLVVLVVKKKNTSAYLSKRTGGSVTDMKL